MEVILLERIHKLGNFGDVVNVKPGFARNYLIPQQKALRASAANRSYFEERRASIEARNNELRAGAQSLVQKLEGFVLTLIRQSAEDGKLYGSVSSRDVQQALKEAGHDIDRKFIIMDAPFKTIGAYDVPVRPYGDVATTISVVIARTDSEAKKFLGDKEAPAAA
jgi:large subunit ribosomal protein L9